MVPPERLRLYREESGPNWAGNMALGRGRAVTALIAVKERR